MKPDDIPIEIREKIIAEFGSIENWLSSPPQRKLGICPICGDIGLIKTEVEPKEDGTFTYRRWYHTRNMPKEWTINAIRRRIHRSPKTRLSRCERLIRRSYRIPGISCPRCGLLGRPFTSNNGYRFIRHPDGMCYLGRVRATIIVDDSPVQYDPETDSVEETGNSC